MDIKDLHQGQVILTGTITNVFSHRIRNGNIMTEVAIADTTGTIRGVWFSKSPKTDLEKGSEYVFEGKYEHKYGRLALQQPSYRPTGKKPPLDQLQKSPYILPQRNYYPFSSRSRSNWGSGMGGWISALLWLLVIGYFIYVFASAHSRGSVTQSYLYCWDVGAPSPHHLGHPVIGDHLCSDSELGK